MCGTMLSVPTYMKWLYQKERRERKGGKHICGEIIAKIFPNLIRNSLQILEVPHITNRIQNRIHTWTFIIVKPLEQRWRENLERDKCLIVYRETTIWLMANITGNNKGQKAVEWHIQVLNWKQNKTTTKTLSTKNSESKNKPKQKLFFKNESKMNIFPRKQKQREYITSRPVLQEVLKA